MSNIEKLVPPPELCKRIPVGKFEASALVLIFWHKSPNTPVEIRTRCEVENDPEFDDLVEDQRIIIYPAPTLQEILAELARRHALISVTALLSGGWQVFGWRTPAEEDSNPATAALKLWLEVYKEEHTNKEDVSDGKR